MAKKRKLKKKIPHVLSQGSHSTSSHLRTLSSGNKTLSKGRFLEAIRGEAFGSHPGLADVRLKVFVYNPIARREIRLPEKQIDLLVGTIGEVDELLKVIRKAIEGYIRGYEMP